MAYITKLEEELELEILQLKQKLEQVRGFGKNKVIQGDCLEVMRDIPNQSIDLILCDLPYGTTACKWDVIIPFDLLWGQYKRIIKPNSAIVLTASQPFTSQLVMSNLEWFKYEWTWIKNKSSNFLNAKKQPLRQTENILVFYENNEVYNPQKTQGHKPVNSFTKRSSDGETTGKTQMGFSGGGQTDRHPTNVLNFPVVNNDNSNGDKFHPTQKPVPLFEYLIKTYTNEGALVLDNCAGSGTTGIAALNTNRNYILIEKEEKYIDVINKRISDWHLNMNRDLTTVDN